MPSTVTRAVVTRDALSWVQSRPADDYGLSAGRSLCIILYGIGFLASTDATCSRFGCRSALVNGVGLALTS